MNHDRDDAGEDALSGIDLHAWRVPPPATVDPSLLVRALSPASPPKRPRLAWVMAAIVLVNALVATLLVILVLPGEQTTVTVQPAGGGSVDARVKQLLQRLEQEQRDLEIRLAEIQRLQALIVELSEKVRQYEQDGKRDRTVPKQRDRQPPDRVERLPIEPVPVDPDHIITPPELSSCDEVSCVLSNYQGPCCAKFRAPPITSKNPSANGVPDYLDRQSISNGIAKVKASVTSCGDRSTVKGKVKVRVHVGANGLVTRVSIEATPDPALGACVAAAIKRAVFERTQSGGSFSYPFVF